MNHLPDDLLVQLNVRIPLRQRIAMDRYLAQRDSETDSDLPDTLSGIARKALQEFLDQHTLEKAG